jgi:ABC-type phosphate transport system auxiliary subunit
MMMRGMRRWSQEVRRLVADYEHEKHSSPTQRRLLKRIIKAYDEKETALTMASKRIEDLTAQIEASRKLKRKKVQIDPNAAFADIEAIRKAQIEAGEVSPDDDEVSEDSSTPTEEGSCIVVGES